MCAIYCPYDVYIRVRIKLLMCVRFFVVFLHSIMNNVDAGCLLQGWVCTNVWLKYSSSHARHSGVQWLVVNTFSFCQMSVWFSDGVLAWCWAAIQYLKPTHVMDCMSANQQTCVTFSTERGVCEVLPTDGSSLFWKSGYFVLTIIILK
jgi:hypothetical protein